MAGVSPLPELIDDLPRADEAQVLPRDLLHAGGMAAHRLDLLPEQRVFPFQGFDLPLELRLDARHAVNLEQSAIPDERQEEDEAQDGAEEDQADPWPFGVSHFGIRSFGTLRTVSIVEPLGHHRAFGTRKASTPGKRAAPPSSSSMRSS